jgi:ATP phosphoribosyltransferase regulatory subunit
VERSAAAARGRAPALREAGETVVYRLPGEGAEPDAPACDRELVHAGGRWLVRACEPAPAAADPTTT